MDTIKALKILMTVLLSANVIVGVAILTGYLDLAALFDLPDTFNTPAAITLLITGIWGLLAPYLPKYRNK